MPGGDQGHGAARYVQASPLIVSKRLAVAFNDADREFLVEVTIEPLRTEIRSQKPSVVEMRSAPNLRTVPHRSLPLLARQAVRHVVCASEPLQRSWPTMAKAGSHGCPGKPCEAVGQGFGQSVNALFRLTRCLSWTNCTSKRMEESVIWSF
jgi:hypothetical protein